jgi:AraC family transcriptional regulator
MNQMKFGEVRCAHKDGSPPLTLVATSPPGESGVSVLRMRFQGGAYFSATTQQHLICFQLSPRLQLECSMAGQRLQHETTTGALAICPAGIDCTAETEASAADMLLVAIKPGQLALAAAEDSALEAQLNERLSGYDRELLRFACALAAENAAGHPNGPLFWNEAASRFVSRLVFGHTSIPDSLSRGTLGQPALQRIRDYVMAHLAEPIEVAELAKLAGRSSFYFSRVFAKSVGMTPHRYVVHLRLQAAIERVRKGQAGLAEIAADTGFSDQSHLSRWVRRVHGVALSQLDT